MKTLVVYYSFEGSTKLIAETIAHELNADCAPIIPQKECKTHGVMKYVWGGKKALTRQSPELFPLSNNPEDYDVIIVGTPVWAFTYAPPVRTFFKRWKFSGKKVSLFCCHEGVMGRTLHAMEKACPHNDIVETHNFFRVFANKKEAVEKARAWATAIQRSTT